MSVNVSFVGRLGNNLFQYALGRIIAEHHGFQLNCDRSPIRSLAEHPVTPSFGGVAINNGPSVLLEELPKHFPKAPLRLAGRSVSTPIECFELGKGDDWDGHTIDLAAILRNSKKRQVRLFGYFQRYEYYAPYRNQIRGWFAPRAPAPHFKVNPQDVLVNIRRGFDYEFLGWALPFSYYDKILCGMKDVGRVYICGTCVDDRVKAHFKRYEPIYYDGSPMEHFQFISSFNRIALSNSTFTWWCAFLSEASELYAPRSSQVNAYSFTGFPGVDLHMKEDRYKEVDYTEAIRFAALSRNRTVRASLDKEKCHLEVSSSAGAAIQVVFGRDTVPFVEWLMGQDVSLEYSELFRQYKAIDRFELHKLIEQLVKAGFLSVELKSLA